MAVPKRKVSKARRDKRRSNVCKLAVAGFVKCSKCGEFKRPYRVCLNCGNFTTKKGKNQVTTQVLEVEDPKAKAKA